MRSRRWLRWLPWLVTIVALTALLIRFPIGGIVDEARAGNLWAMIPLAIALPVVRLFMSGLWDYLVLTRCVSVRYVDVLRAKAATAVLMGLGYAFSNGGMAAWITRRTGARVKTSAGAVLYIMASDLASATLVAAVAAWLGAADLPADLRVGVGVVAPLIAAGLIALSLSGRLLRLVRRDVDAEFLKAWTEISARRYLANVAGRCLTVLVICTGTWAAMQGFGLDVPLRAVMVYLPVIMMVGALPINVAGLGAVQAAWLLFEPWAPGERILAWQVCWTIMLAIATVLRGLPFLRRVLREITARPQAPPTS